MSSAEALSILGDEHDIEAAIIATKQAAIRQGFDPLSQINSIVRGNNTYMFSTVGMTDAEHTARLQELKDLGQLDDYSHS